MDVSITVKVRLKLSDSQVGNQLRNMMEQYTNACNYVSQYIIDHNFELKQSELNKALYYDLRDRFNLKAQLAQSVLKTVIARYKAINTQMKQRDYRYQDINTGKWYHEKRDVTYIQHCPKFRRLQADLVRRRDWSYSSSTQQLSINTLNERVKVTSICKGFDKYLDGTWKFGTAKLLTVGNKWYLHIAATKEFDDFDKQQVKHVVGIDRGLRQMITAYDEHGNTKFVNGQQILRKREKYLKVRQELQRRGTKSAKRRLKHLSGKENRWMTDVNHQLSKALIQMFGSNTLYVLENLNGVSFERTDLPKRLRNQNRSWAFYQLEQFLTYKAHLNNSEMITVNPKYTSQRCPKCGIVKKSNRNHEIHEYQCSNCGYRSNDDRIAAMNIQELGKQYMTGIKKPSFTK